ncbi:myosin tail [Gorgonomyces haynaldii]|nr:myosin tail [Gorgonomyces haynaldii]
MKELLEEYQQQSKLAEDRVRRAESHASEVQAELTKERNLNIELEKAKLALEKNMKEMSSRLLDYEALSIGRESTAARRLEARIDELTEQLEQEQRDKSEALKNMRKHERMVRELQFQLGEKDKLKARFDDEQEKMEQKVRKMRSQLEELEQSESALQLAKRRAEREAQEFREKSIKFEKEVEKFKARMDRSQASTPLA